MKSVEYKALALRIDLSALCARAGLSRTIATRWKKGAGTPSLPTIQKLERELAAVEAERIAA